MNRLAQSATPKEPCWQAEVLVSSVVIALLYAHPIAAQVIPDSTLPAGERSQVTGNPNFQIDGGARRGGNLFHSFDQFSVPTGGSAYFNNAVDVQNIFSRVTGRSVSNIDGLIRANGTANLFLLNPNGILFGPNARLNIGGSFVATTANSINFADDFQYSATNPQTTPLLTISVPVGLQMGANPGRIEVQGNGYNLSTTIPLLSPVVRNSATIGLQVPDGQTLALVGGNIDIRGGVLTAEQGRIELGGVQDGTVSLNERFALGYSDVQTLSNVYFSQQALADASGGGAIQVQGNQVTLVDGSLLLIDNQGTQSGGNIRVTAAQTLDISGVSSDGRIFGGLNSQTVGVGNGADIAIFTGQLALRDGVRIATHTYSSARSGDITIQALDSVYGVGFAPMTPSLLTVINAFAFSSGDAGNVTVSTRNITLLDGAAIATPTFGAGRGGDLTVNASNSIRLVGQSSLFSPSTLVSITSGTGDAGRVTVNTSRLVIQNGGAVSTSTLGSGDAGSVIINARESVEISGRPPASLASFVGSSAPIAPEALRQAFGLPPAPSGSSGNVTINTDRLRVTDNAVVEVSNAGVGNAGIVRINANSVFLDTGGAITAATASGEGGNINLNVQNDLLLRNNSQITSSAGATGNGGNINITARTLSLLNDTQLSAAVSGVGNAGDITVSANAVTLRDGAQLRTSTSSSGRAGNITINTPTLQLSGRTSGLFAGTTSTGDAGNLTIQPRGNGQTVQVELNSGAQISASTSSSGRGGRLTITAPDSITLTGNGSIISAETSGSGIGGNLTLRTGNLNIQNQAQVTVSSLDRGSAGSLFVDADRIFLDNGGSIRADTSGGGGNISLRSPLIVLRNGSNITTNATGRNIPGGNIEIDTGFVVAVPKEDSNISANSEDFRGGNVNIEAIALYGIQPSLVSTPLSDITATGATSALPGIVDVTTATIDPTAGLVALPTDVADASQLIAQGCPANVENSFVIIGRGGLPPTPAQELDDTAEWQDRSILTIPQQANRERGARNLTLDTNEGSHPRVVSQTITAAPIIEATDWQRDATGEVILIANTSDLTIQNSLYQLVACHDRQ